MGHFIIKEARRGLERKETWDVLFSDHPSTSRVRWQRLPVGRGHSLGRDRTGGLGEFVYTPLGYIVLQNLVY